MNSNTLCALFIGLDPNRAASLTSNFHRLGYICRSTSVEEMGRLGSAIRSDNPDLLVFDESQAAIELEHCLEAIKAQQLDLPLILLTNSEERLPDHQVVDVLAPDSLERICRACLREFWALQTRRELAQTQKELKAAEDRSEQILLQSEEPIAYVADGMIVSVNRLFAERFGFEGPDDLDYQPIIDLIAEQDHERFKTALRSVSDKESPRIDLSCVHQNGKELDTILKLSHAVLDGEDCVQLSVREDSGSGSPSSNYIDPTTGFASPMRFAQQLEDVSAHGLAGSGQGALLLIALDRYPHLRTEFGAAGLAAINRNLADLLISQFPKATFGRVDGDLLGAIINNVDGDEALAAAKKVCALAAQNPVTIGKLSANYTITIGVQPIGKSKLPAALDLIDNLVGVCEQLREDIGDNGIGNTAALFVRAKQQLSQGADPQQLFEDAKADNRLQLLFQPIVSLADEAKQYYEVNLTLKDQEADEISGQELLNRFESQGKSTELDRWIIVEATKQLAGSRRKGSQTRLVINLSCNVLRDKNLGSWLGVALKAAELPGDTLVLQFKAETVAKAIKPALDFTKNLRKIDANIALRSEKASGDDAPALKQLQPILTTLDINPQDKDALQEAIIRVQETGSKAVVQGVESAATLATLWQLKPDYVQGSYIHPPSPEMDYDFGED